MPWNSTVPITVSPLALYQAMRKVLGSPSAILESCSFDERNAMSVLAFVPRQQFTTAANSLEAIEAALLHCQRLESSAEIPFSGGLIGGFSYEFFQEIEPSINIKNKTPLPHGFWAEFSVLVFFNHQNQTITFVHLQDSSLPIQEWLTAAAKELLPLFSAEKLKNFSPDFSAVESGWELSEFSPIFEQAKEHLRTGDIFQMILSNQWKINLQTDPVRIYQLLRQLEPTTHLFCLEWGDPIGAIIGASPEILGSKRGTEVCYRPIAATRGRKKDAAGDARMLADMRTSKKENAEHDMLVDLGRNDLNRVCVPGSVKVLREKYGKCFASVQHLVTDLVGELEADTSATDFFRAIFPAGTVVGAPKIRAAQIAAQQEKFSREIYGGALGYFSADGNAELAIMIRTARYWNQQLIFRTGAGVVLDSVVEDEWLEMQNKAGTLTRIAQFLAANGDQ